MGERDHLIRPELQKSERIALPKNVNNRVDYNPYTYVSIQERVNNDPEFEKEYIDQLISDGWKRLENIDEILSEDLVGRFFKYRLNGKGLSGAKNGTFRSGGRILGMKDGNREYILYRAHNGVVFPIQLSDLKEVYIQDKISVTFVRPKPNQISNYPVYLPDPETNEETVIFYAKNKQHMKEFMEGVNYRNAVYSGKWKFRKTQERSKKTAYFKRPLNVTVNPVYLPDPITNERVVVYYARDKHMFNRFITTDKFKYAQETLDWGFEN